MPAVAISARDIGRMMEDERSPSFGFFVKLASEFAVGVLCSSFVGRRVYESTA
jgi:hypothetical protein